MAAFTSTERRGGSRDRIDARWQPRARRAHRLIEERPHTAALLGFYVALLELQTAAVGAVELDASLAAVTASDGAPLLRFERLPLDVWSVPFHEFCRQMPEVAPPPIVVAAQALAHAAAYHRAEVLLGGLSAGDVTGTASAVGVDPGPLAFLGRAFLSPLAERLAESARPGDQDPRASTCPTCGWPAQVSKLEDETGAEGNRRLICAFCATDWVFPRSVCVQCGTTGDEGLEFHADETLTYVRVEACRSCRHYLKTVDRRVLGLAEPLVEDLATPELDLWAAEQGREKRVPNLLGF